ncbi:MAG: bifunctional diaminohydroxyphosphoribosylaminopyrimidine deaminase/5-amino-6-(5-phosphoribosylamino)uracil reductase RibD [Lachnospiraceae bacterium]|nr:bifunctional diaminohydroxyphosphoribosylaminopyrimidine deaminase/5-amino-6-(5-phosphoribosylamino)uracil reductase RibD [Lachnospiraceae bacterium]
MEKEQYMRRAIELAKLGTGRVNPNPLVGAVIVKDGKIIGEGYHMVYGDLHAERNAFRNLPDKEAARGAELYVTLEPCCHHGKQPPCTDAIIEHGISKVYVGSNDPNTLVAGKGIQILKEAGISVVTEFLKEECDALNPVFFHYITTKTPFVLMKYAMTLDGKIATRTGHAKWVSGEVSRERVQHTRNAMKAIMVGIGTVLNDDPGLTCRIEGGRNPIRIICDSKLRIPLSSQVVATAGEVPTVIATIEPHAEYNRFWHEQKEELEREGAEVLIVKETDGRLDLKDLMKRLGERQIDGILLEGGSTLNYAALQAGIVNRIEVYVAPKFFGGAGFYTPVGGEGVGLATEALGCQLISFEPIGEDLLLTYEIQGRAAGIV